MAGKSSKPSEPTGGGAKGKAKAKPKVAAEDEATKLIIKNRRAFFEYEVTDEWECGIALLGTEVKSLRGGQIQLSDAYARFIRGELFLVNANIAPYKMGGYANHEPTRPRKLLMHRIEINRLVGKVDRAGYTLVPLDLHFKGGRIKLEIGLAKGKKQHDKRAGIKDREWNRDKQRLMRNAARGKS